MLSFGERIQKKLKRQKNGGFYGEETGRMD